MSHLPDVYAIIEIAAVATTAATEDYFLKKKKRVLTLWTVNGKRTPTAAASTARLI